MTTAVVLLGVLAVLALTSSGGPGSGDDDGIQHAGSPFQGVSRRGVASPDFRLKDQDGRVVSLASLRGRPAIVTFMYSTCEDTCPATALQIASSLDELGEDVPTVIVSVDPKNDTPGNAQRFLNKMRLRGRAHFVLGTQAQLEPIWNAYAILPQGQGFEHSAVVLVLDAEGRQQVSFPAEKLTSEHLAHDVRAVQAQDQASAR
ncbi:SCO family protein [Patulibacter sp. NPDC049589]|uniref:SCO family protein n=1 Tax=Patulibacter sp. NPDC049589 TaxID=3154731 RepID=UPI003412E313